ncbi:MAG: EamA family transporter [bacterium]|nr:EamA family transporter [bacterium]
MGYIILALIAMVFAGVGDLFWKMGLNAGINVYVFAFYIYLATGFFFGALCVIKKYSLKIDKKLVKYSVPYGILLFLATIATLIALKTGNASVIIPIVRMGFVITAICAFIFLREKLTLRKGMGLFFAGLSLVLLSI